MASMAFNKLAKLTPRPIKTILRKFRFNHLLGSGDKKYDVELSFQRVWAEEFKQSKDQVLEYWKNYRCLDNIITLCKITGNTRVLDVGCGISTVLHYINGRRFGIDPLADEYLTLYEYPEGIDVRKGFGEDIPFPTQIFDVVFCSNVLDHVTSPKRTLDEIYRVLKPGGYFVLTVTIFREKTHRDLAHPHNLTKADLYSQLEGRFKPIFEKESPWMGLRAYAKGSRKSFNNELILILEKG